VGFRATFALALLAVALAPFACTDVAAPTRIFVSRVPSDTRVSREDGATLTLNRWDLDPPLGLNRGYWVVRAEHEWRELFPTLDADRIPLLPGDIDFGKEVLLVAAPTERAATESRIHAVIDTAEAGIHVYVSESLPGQGCPPPPKDEHVPASAVRVPTFDKEVHFHIETKRETPCEAPPAAKVGCRPSGSNEDLVEKLESKPGSTVVCSSDGQPGMRPTVDRTWSFRSLPQGTAAKMTVTGNGSGVTFGTDAYGTYSVGLDITDDLGRTSRATGDVEVLPSKDTLVLQMLWTKFDPNDDPSTFPRVELHVVGDKTPIVPTKATTFASRNQPWILVIRDKGDCALGNDKPPDWCHTKVIGPTTTAEVKTDAFPQYRIGVRYLDDRYAGQPVLCVRAFRGALASEWCDKAVRSEGNWWDVSRVDATTGKPPEPPKPPPPPTPPPAASGSAAPVVPSNGQRKPGEAWSPMAAATSKPSATPAASAARPPAASSATPPTAPAPAKPTPSATPAPVPSGSAKPRQPGDPWTP
jgi:hypothetical protein